jgi:hypothetical protein
MKNCIQAGRNTATAWSFAGTAGSRSLVGRDRIRLRYLLYIFYESFYIALFGVLRLCIGGLS